MVPKNPREPISCCDFEVLYVKYEKKTRQSKIYRLQTKTGRFGLDNTTFRYTTMFVPQKRFYCGKVHVQKCFVVKNMVWLLKITIEVKACKSLTALFTFPCKIIECQPIM